MKYLIYILFLYFIGALELSWGRSPTGAILYMSMGFIFLAPRFDRELARKEILDRAMSAQRPHARENYE